MSLSEPLLRLREGVRELASLDVGFNVFGSGSHRYAFRPAFPEIELAAIEAAQRFSLPEDYRAFITVLGNGGAGPAYGIMPFQGDDPEDYTKYDQLGLPWKYSDAYNPTGILDGDEPGPEPEGDDEDDDDEDHHGAYWRAFHYGGSLHLCHYGCASRKLLVLTGPHRGEVWADESANDYGFYPLLVDPDDPASPRHTFTTWYQAWLDQELAAWRAK